MMTAEASIWLLNAVIIFLAYTAIYPKVAGKDLHKIAMLDCISTIIALIIVATKYWSTGVALTLLAFELNWFWFTLITYSVIEIPIALWYFKNLVK